ncbi:hypothetical protein EU545_00930 [Candidatus Thorarchaeota archaeon]|nr:MAG: hypothetical protein EU545_00930 [Candidatus Thorarchaeota archaeon]
MSWIYPKVLVLRILVTSEQDLASQTIKAALIEEYDFIETEHTFDGHPVLAHGDSIWLVTSSRDLIYSNHLEKELEAEAFIFCSRHRSKSGRPSLLVHSTGNLGDEAAFGGRPASLSVSVASLVSVALKTLFRERNERDLTDFDVSLEVTHHGPTELDTPMLFVELGSDEDYWTHEEGASVVAKAAMNCATTSISGEAVIGFGGTHYASKFNKLVLYDEYNIGHMAPKYALDGITPSVVDQMIQRSAERVRAAVVDWKGTNADQRDTFMPMLEQQGIEVIREG